MNRMSEDGGRLYITTSMALSKPLTDLFLSFFSSICILTYLDGEDGDTKDDGEAYHCSTSRCDRGDITKTPVNKIMHIHFQ